MRTVKPATAGGEPQEGLQAGERRRGAATGFLPDQSIHSDIGLARSVVTNDAVTRGLTMPALNPRDRR